jgi:putative effector of murein hydrolase
METVFLFAILTTILFSFAKFVEMKYLDKTTEIKPLKFFIRDAIIVFACSLVSAYGYFHLNSTVTDFFEVLTETKTIKPENTQIFTDDPAF